MSCILWWTVVVVPTKPFVEMVCTGELQYHHHWHLDLPPPRKQSDDGQQVLATSHSGAVSHTTTVFTCVICALS